VDRGAACYGQACGGPDVPDRPAPRGVADQAGLTGVVAECLARDDAVYSWIANSGAEPFRDAEAETDFRGLWSALPEGQKQELGALFARMLMKLFRVWSGVEG